MAEVAGLENWLADSRRRAEAENLKLSAQLADLNKRDAELDQKTKAAETEWAATRAKIEADRASIENDRKAAMAKVEERSKELEAARARLSQPTPEEGAAIAAAAMQGHDERPATGRIVVFRHIE